MKKVQINSHKFEVSHGRKPKGHGAWGFIVMDDSSNTEADIFFTPAMTLADARKFAANHVREHFAAELDTGFLYLEVAP